MTDPQPHPRAASRRENPLERRKKHLDPMPGERDCKHLCPVAVRNAEQIETLFRRMDEERGDNKTRFEGYDDNLDHLGKNCVKWSRFSWIVGSMFTLILTLLLVVWTALSGVDSGLEASIKTISESVAKNSGKIDVTVTRIDDFITNHQLIYDGYIRDQQRIADKLDSLSKDIRALQVNIGEIHGRTRSN